MEVDERIQVDVRVRVPREADGEIVVKEAVEPGTLYAEVSPGSGEVRAPVRPECEAGVARPYALFPMVMEVRPLATKVDGKAAGRWRGWRWWRGWACRAHGARRAGARFALCRVICPPATAADAPPRAILEEGLLETSAFIKPAARLSVDASRSAALMRNVEPPASAGGVGAAPVQ